MTKPHEETWVTGEGALSGALYSGDTWIGSFTNPERARLAREAPTMAQMLLEYAGSRGGPDDAHWHTYNCWRVRNFPGPQRRDGVCTHDCGAIRGVLAAAVVLP